MTIPHPVKNEDAGQPRTEASDPLEHSEENGAAMSVLMPQILLMGAPIGIGNRGVSALGSSVVRLCLKAVPRARISLLMGNRDAIPIGLMVEGKDYALPVVNHRMSPRAPLSQQLWWIALVAAMYRLLPWRYLRRRLAASNPWVGAVACADLVADIRGGDSFSDIYGLGRFLTGSLPALAVIWIRGDIVLLPQTYGPYRTGIARMVARYILLRSRAILSRDAAGLDVVKELTKGRREAAYCPDVAFALESVVPRNLQIAPPLPDRSGCVLVGLNVSGLLYNGGYSRDNMFALKLDYRLFLDDLLQELLARPDVEVLLVPHTFSTPGRVESDNGACESLAARVPDALSSRVHLIAAEFDQFNIKGVIGLCDFFVGSRMHACIAALSQAIPAVGVAYSRKFVGVFASVGADAWVVDGRDMSTDQAVRRVMELFDQRQALKPVLAARVSEAQERLRETFCRLLPPPPGNGR